MEPDLAAMVLDSLGLTIADLERAGADVYDLEPLKCNGSIPRVCDMTTPPSKPVR
jgi:hypothetical protein